MASDSPGPLLLTGASGGLGLELSRLYLESGARDVAFHYRSHEEDALRALLKKHGLPAEKHLFQADLTKEDEVARLQKDVTAALGDVKVLVNLAGGSSNGMSWKLGVDAFRSVVDANLTATFLACRQFVPAMRNAGGGRIVNVSSVTAFIGAVGASHYSAAKAGLVGFTRSLAMELASKGVTVNALALGYFDRGMITTVPPDVQAQIKGRIPLGRFGTSEEIFAALRYLTGPGSGYLTGQVLHLNGGLYL